MATARINIPNETLAEFTERYRVLSNPQFVNYIMRKVTEEVDNELKFRMQTLASHPKDTGLLKKSWKLPETYLKTHFGKIWQVYLINDATVGAQARLKQGMLQTVHRKKKRVGRHNLKRYMPWVDKRTKFYTKQLRVMRNKINPIFKQQIGFILEQLHSARPELFTAQESQQLRGGGV